MLHQYLASGGSVITRLRCQERHQPTVGPVSRSQEFLTGSADTRTLSGSIPFALSTCSNA